MTLYVREVPPDAGASHPIVIVGGASVTMMRFSGGDNGHPNGDRDIIKKHEWCFAHVNYMLPLNKDQEADGHFLLT